MIFWRFRICDRSRWEEVDFLEVGMRFCVRSLWFAEGVVWEVYMSGVVG